MHLRNLIPALAAFVFVFFGRVGLCAADSWYSIQTYLPHPNLWGVAYDGTDTVVAVGEQGAILVRKYSFSSAYFPRLLGTSVWLTSVSYGAQRWVAVGDTGTILTSDDGGDTWTARISGTTHRLNAVAYGNGRWLAVGEAGTILTSSDGIDWSARPALGTGFFRGLAFGQGRFVFGGARGSLYTTTDAATFTAVPLATTSDVEGVAISPTRYWIVGSQGLLATATQLGTWTFAPAGSATVRAVAAKGPDEASAVGDNSAAAFCFESLDWKPASRSPAFLATAATLGQNEVIAVGFGIGLANTVISSALSVGIQPSTVNAVYGQDVRLSASVSGATAIGFQWTKNGIDLPGATLSEFLLPGGDLANAASYRVRAVTSAGTVTSGGILLTVIPGGRPEVIDPNFNSALFPFDPSIIVPQPDGKILVAGTFTVTPAGGATSGLARLNHDGSLDLGFRAGDGIPALSSIYQLKLLPDRRIYVRGNFTSIGGIARPGLARLLPNGTVDPTFAPDATLGRLSSSTPDSTGRLYVSSDEKIYRLSLSGSVETSWDFKGGVIIGVDRNHRVLITQYYTSPLGNFGPGSAVYRFSSDGTRDASYSLSVFYGIQPELVVGNEVFGRSAVIQGKFGASYELKKVREDGTTDDDYSAKIPRSPYPAIPIWSYGFRPDGSVVIAINSSTDVRSYNYAGDREPFYATTVDLTDYSIRAVEADGSLLVQTYSFPASASNPTSRLARIRPVSGRPGRLTNLSVRSYVASPGDPLIVGFVSTGSGTTNALVRAIGPGLLPFTVADAMPDPRLSLLRDGTTVAENDNWSAALASRFSATGAFALTSDSTDAALESPIGPGNYTSVITPVSGGGTVLAELYESSDPSTLALRRFINVSALNRVDPTRPLIAGFSITGEVPVTLLIRGVGPTLTSFGVAHALADPQLKLYRNGTPLWENDRWDSSQYSELIAAARQSGAFPLPDIGSNDAAMLVTLAPGGYTAIVSAPTNTAGTALVEVYEVPPRP